ncbi:MAG: hypothetical protein DMD95_21050 [Candidatus Rokuibacteriota bacterium]|nr:MAG: hypothetical protein DMD95_21050 [Candidatus Rokubacteria bacterium]
MADSILVEKTQGVAIVTMNRPEQLNAMNAQLGAELREAVKRMSADDDVGCIVITGAGNRAFSAGGDIHEQREDDRRYTQAELDARNAIRARGSYEISACPKPTIGMMNGLAYGGAAVLASSLDMRIGCEHASFRFLAAAYGRINSTWTLPNQVGWPVAKELLFSARVVEAGEAHRIGLLNHLVPCAELRARRPSPSSSPAEDGPRATPDRTARCHFLAYLRNLATASLYALLRSVYESAKPRLTLSQDSAEARPSSSAFFAVLSRVAFSSLSCRCASALTAPVSRET